MSLSQVGSLILSKGTGVGGVDPFGRTGSHHPVNLVPDIPSRDGDGHDPRQWVDPKVKTLEVQVK